MSYIFNSSGIVTITGGTVSPTVLNIPSAASPAQTAEGGAVWDSDDDVLTIGDGASRKTLVDLSATQIITGTKTFNALILGGSLNANGQNITSATAFAVETTGTTTHLTLRTTGTSSNVIMNGFNSTRLQVNGVDHLVAASNLAEVYATSGLRLRGTSQIVRAFNATLTIAGAADSAATRDIQIQTNNAAGTGLVTRLTFGSNAATVPVTWASAYHVGLKHGLAGTATGAFTIDGGTSGVVTVTVAAAAGTWTLTLPPDDGDAGEQLQTNGSGVTTWEGAASTREVKKIVGLLNPKEALQTILNTPIEKWFYKKEARGVGGDYETEFAGVVGDRAPWAMKDKGKHFNPINAFGYAAAAIQALEERVRVLEHA